MFKVISVGIGYMKFTLRKLNKSLLVSFLAVLALCPIGVSAAAQEVYNTSNNPLFITNTTWDQRLSTLQTSIQDIRSYASTIMNRFGWNGTYTFSQGFELLYNDVHALASNTSNSDILAAFNREFQSGTPQVASQLSSKGYLRAISLQLNGGNSQVPSLIDDINDNIISVNSDTSSIDSKIDTTNSRLNSIITYESSNNILLNGIDGTLYDMSPLVYNISDKTSIIKVNTDNIAVDTQAINDYTSHLPDMDSNLSILRNFFADNDTLAQKAAAEQTSDYAINNFTGNGSESASASDFARLKTMESNLKDSLDTGNVNPQVAFDALTDDTDTGWGWFSQATYDSINPQPTRGGLLNSDSYMQYYYELENHNMRKDSSNTPLLDANNQAIEDAIKGVFK